MSDIWWKWPTFSKESNEIETWGTSYKEKNTCQEAYLRLKSS